MVFAIETKMMTTDQLEDLLHEAVIKLTIDGQKSDELQMVDEYFNLGDPDGEDGRRRDLLTLLEIVDPTYEARLAIEQV